MFAPIASSVTVAAPLGCLFIGLSLDKIGRISTFKIGLWPCFIGWLLIVFANDSNIMIIGRLLTGLALCMIYFIKYFNYSTSL